MDARPNNEPTGEPVSPSGSIEPNDAVDEQRPHLTPADNSGDNCCGRLATDRQTLGDFGVSIMEKYFVLAVIFTVFAFATGSDSMHGAAAGFGASAGLCILAAACVERRDSPKK